MTEFAAVLRILTESGVDFIVIGGVAASLHGSARATFDVDVVYERSARNIANLVAALEPLSPYLRGAPPGLPFRWDAETVKRGLNFTLKTSLGNIDLLGEVTGGGGYHDLLPYTSQMEAFGYKCFVLDLVKLIQVKRAAGRPKDFETIAELEAIREERGDI